MVLAKHLRFEWEQLLPITCTLCAGRWLVWTPVPFSTAPCTLCCLPSVLRKCSGLWDLCGCIFFIFLCMIRCDEQKSHPLALSVKRIQFEIDVMHHKTQNGQPNSHEDFCSVLFCFVCCQHHHENLLFFLLSQKYTNKRHILSFFLQFFLFWVWFIHCKVYILNCTVRYIFTYVWHHHPGQVTSENSLCLSQGNTHPNNNHYSFIMTFYIRLSLTPCMWNHTDTHSEHFWDLSTLLCMSVLLTVVWYSILWQYYNVFCILLLDICTVSTWGYYGQSCEQPSFICLLVDTWTHFSQLFTWR